MDEGNSEDSFVMEDIAYEVQQILPAMFAPLKRAPRCMSSGKERARKHYSFAAPRMPGSWSSLCQCFQQPMTHHAAL